MGDSCKSKAVLCISCITLGVRFHFRRMGSAANMTLGGGSNASSLFCDVRAMFTSAGRIVRTGRFVGSSLVGRGTTRPRRACVGSPTNVFARTVVPCSSVCGGLAGSALGTIGLAFAGCGVGDSCRCDVDTPGSILLVHGRSLGDFFRRGGIESGVASFAAARGTFTAGRCMFDGVTHLIAAYVGRGRTTGGTTGSGTNDS